MNAADVYFAFRLAFIELPHVRIRTVDHGEHDMRPGYNTGRFKTPATPAVEVFLHDDREGPQFEIPARHESTLYGVSDRNATVEAWAKATRREWSLL